MRPRKKTDSRIVPAIPTHPGEILREEMRARHMTQRELANRIGRPYQVINGMVDGRRSISAETALDLETVFPGIPAEFWLRADHSYRLNVAHLAHLQQKSA